MGSTEKSRYIEQLKEELKDQKQIEISEKIISVDIVNNKVDYNTVSKSEKIIENLQNLAEYGLSPSALNKYIQCPLDFYYS